VQWYNAMCTVTTKGECIYRFLKHLFRRNLVELWNEWTNTPNHF
jgi:hypothetical protein